MAKRLLRSHENVKDIYNNPADFRIMRTLSIMIVVPTSMPSVLWGSFLQSHAAIGAQMIPPAIRPRTISQL